MVGVVVVIGAIAFFAPKQGPTNLFTKTFVSAIKGRFRGPVPQAAPEEEIMRIESEYEHSSNPTKA